MEMTVSAALVFFILIACVFDLRSYRIPNALIVISLMTGIAMRLATESMAAAGSIAAGALVPLCVCLGLLALSMLGAGDIKLLMVSGVYLGPVAITRVMVFTVFLAGVWSLVKLLRYRMLGERMSVAAAYFSGIVSGMRGGSYISGSDMKNSAPWLLHMSVFILAAVIIEIIVFGV